MTVKTQDITKASYPSILKQVDTLSMSDKKNLLLFLKKKVFMENLEKIRNASSSIEIKFDEITALVDEVRSERYKNQKKK